MFLRIFLLIILLPLYSYSASRIKDIVYFESVRDNLLMGHGLVVGLNGTGDNIGNIMLTQKELSQVLGRLGGNMTGTNAKTKNVAAVVVTANLPPFARAGSRINVNVSALGDAKSLQDGTLLATPLVGADGQVYAVAQGKISASGFIAKAPSGSSVSKNVTTNVTVVNGAIVEKEIGFDFNSLNHIRLALRNPDMTTANLISETINLYMNRPISRAEDPGTVTVTVPIDYRDKVVAFMAEIEQLLIQPDNIAKIIIDEASGTIVMGENVKISPVAVAQGNLTITITNDILASQPASFGPDNSETVILNKSNILIDDQKDKQLGIVYTGATLGELVGGLNALGVGPRDLINILANIKAAGAIQAEIEVR